MNEKIYNALMSQKFVDWYTEAFEDHVTGEENCRTKEQIIQDITDIFNTE